MQSPSRHGLSLLALKSARYRVDRPTPPLAALAMRTCLLTFFALSFSTVDAADIRLSGTVYDDVGNPVFAAQLKLLASGDQAVSDPRGEWRMEGIADATPASQTVDTLLVTWKDTARSKFPLVTYQQAGMVQILPTVHLADRTNQTRSPISGREIGLASPPMLFPVTTNLSPDEPLLIPGPFGSTTIPVAKAEEVIAGYRKGARIMHNVDRAFIGTGLVAMGVGGILTVVGLAQDEDGLLVAGCVTAGTGLMFTLIPLGNSNAETFENQADELQRQLDERRSRRRSDLQIFPFLDRKRNPGLAMRGDF